MIEQVACSTNAASFCGQHSASPGFPDRSDRALWALRTWLDTWAGIGRVAVGMERQGFDLQLTREDERSLRATFYTTGMGHSPTAAWEALTKTDC